MSNEVVIEVVPAERLRSMADDDMTVARLGGDELAVLLPDVESVAAAQQSAQRFLVLPPTRPLARKALGWFVARRASVVVRRRTGVPPGAWRAGRGHGPTGGRVVPGEVVRDDPPGPDGEGPDTQGPDTQGQDTQGPGRATGGVEARPGRGWRSASAGLVVRPGGAGVRRSCGHRPGRGSAGAVPRAVTSGRSERRRASVGAEPGPARTGQEPSDTNARGAMRVTHSTTDSGRSSDAAHGRPSEDAGRAAPPRVERNEDGVSIRERR